MKKKLENLPSEWIPNNGGWKWDSLVDQANARLKQIGKHGKRATIKKNGKIKPGKPLVVQFSLPGEGQNSYGLNLPLTEKNLIKAEEICELISGQLVAGTFTMDWFYSLIGKPQRISSKEEEKPLTCGEMLEQYKAYYLKQRKDNKNPDSNWMIYYRHTEKIFLKYKDNLVSLKIIKEAIDCTENNSSTRTYTLNGLANLLKYFDNNDFKSVIKRYKSENNPKPKNKYIPTDTEVMLVYQNGFRIPPSCAKKWRYRYAQWQFLYSLLAIYGLRVHEAWNIKNWDTGVNLKNGDWVAFADDTENTDNEDEQGQHFYVQIEGDKYIPAILDPDNEDFLLCIGDETKTGYRVAFPISPNGVGRNCDWSQKFNIVQPLNLPDIPNALDYEPNTNKRKCTNATGGWFNIQARENGKVIRKSRYGFSPHALRHAYNIRGHKLGITQKMLADSLGHGLRMNSSNYTRHEGGLSKIQGIKQEMFRHSQKQSELEQLKEKVKYLETENERLRTELAMYKAVEESRKNN